jgi:hypothetical protein
MAIQRLYKKRAYHQKQRQKVTTWRLFNFLNPVIWTAVNYLRRGILTLCKGRTLCEYRSNKPNNPEHHSSKNMTIQRLHIKRQSEITRTKQINRNEHERHKHKTLAVWTSQKPIEEVVCWKMLWLYQFTTKRNDRNCTSLPPKATTEGHHMEVI